MGKEILDILTCLSLTSFIKAENSGLYLFLFSVLFLFLIYFPFILFLELGLGLEWQDHAVTQLVTSDDTITVTVIRCMKGRRRMISYNIYNTCWP